MQQRCLKEWCVVGRIDQDEFKNSEFRPRTTTGQYGHQNRKYLSYIAESITNIFEIPTANLGLLYDHGELEKVLESDCDNAWQPEINAIQIDD